MLIIFSIDLHFHSFLFGLLVVQDSRALHFENRCANSLQAQGLAAQTMKRFGLLLMVINHLIAPFVSPWLMIATGEPARHFLTMAFMDPSRYRPDGYRHHARKLTLYLVITSLCVGAIQWLSGITTLLQMPLAWYRENLEVKNRTRSSTCPSS